MWNQILFVHLEFLVCLFYATPLWLVTQYFPNTRHRLICGRSCLAPGSDAPQSRPYHPWYEWNRCRGCRHLVPITRNRYIHNRHCPVIGHSSHMSGSQLKSRHTQSSRNIVAQWPAADGSCAGFTATQTAARVIFLSTRFITWFVALFANAANCTGGWIAEKCVQRLTVPIKSICLFKTVCVWSFLIYFFPTLQSIALCVSFN